MLLYRISCNSCVRFKRKRNTFPVGGVIGKEADGMKVHSNNHGTIEKLTEGCLPRKHVHAQDSAEFQTHQPPNAPV